VVTRLTYVRVVMITLSSMHEYCVTEGSSLSFACEYHAIEWMNLLFLKKRQKYTKKKLYHVTTDSENFESQNFLLADVTSF
jgi:hypothetical protein